jgi:outer membrane protein assembly factor BamB
MPSFTFANRLGREQNWIRLAIMIWGHSLRSAKGVRDVHDGRRRRPYNWRLIMQRAIRTVLVPAFLFLLAICKHATAQDWPQWRGPNRDAKTTGFKAPATWPKSLTKKWQAKVGDGVATPALADGKLYVFTREADLETLRCLDAARGDEIWKQKYEEDPAEGAAGGFPGPRSSPAVAQGKVVTLGVRGILKCRDAASGKQLWMKNDLADSWPQFFTSSSPIIVDNLCISQLGGPQDGGIIAYDLASGQEKWRWMKSGPGYASPVLMTVNSAKVIVAPTDEGRNEGKLVAIAAADGKLLWEMPYREVRYIATTPIVNGSTIIIGGPGSGISALKLKKQGDKIVEERLWSNTDNSLGFNTPVLKDGLVFGISGGDQVFCFNTQSQKTAWTVPLVKPPAAEKEGANKGVGKSDDQRVQAVLVQFVQQDSPKNSDPNNRDRSNDNPGRGFGQGPGRGQGPGQFGPGGPFGRGGGMGRGGMMTRGYGSIVDVGTALLALTPAGELVVFQPTGDSFKELARYKVAEGGTYAYPIPAGNEIYIKDKDTVTLWSLN